MWLAIQLLSLALAAWSAPLQPEKRLLGLTVTPPSQDIFYHPSAGFEYTKPGTILDKRQIPIPLTLTLIAPVTKAAWQILFRSTDDSGNPIAAVTTLFIPADGDTNKFFTQSIAYDASHIDCSPSYILQTLTDTPPDAAAIALALDSGWYTQSPDFEGLSAAFTNGVVSGQVMLDSLRACLQSTSFTNLSPSARIALNGGSGGALGIEWALELQPTYASELKIAGATLGSLTPHIGHVMEHINGGAFAALIPASITGLAKISTTLNTYLNDNLIASTADQFMSANTRCLSQNQLVYAGQNMASYFKDTKWLSSPTVSAEIQRVGVMGLHGVPQVPLYVYKGAQDELSAVADTDALVEKYCQSGAPSIIYIRNILTGHQGESFLGFVGAYEYLQERLNGVPAFQGCAILNSTKSTLNNTDVTVLGSLGNKVVNILDNALPALIST